MEFLLKMITVKFKLYVSKFSVAKFMAEKTLQDYLQSVLQTFTFKKYLS